MCVIYFKPKGHEIISEEKLERMWDSNPHGAGIAWSSNNTVNVWKGIMDFKDLVVALKNIKKSLNIKDVNLVIHFRLASKGQVNLDNTHPFVLADKQPDSLIYTTKMPVLFHNGTLFKFGNSNKSDTYEFATFLGKLKFSSMKKLISILSKFSTDKFLFLMPKRVYLVGSWEKKNGQYFSNLYFDRVTIPYYNYRYGNDLTKIWNKDIYNL